MKIKYLLPAVFLVVIISGCAQTSDYTTAYDRFQKLKDSTGYSIEYAPEISFEFSQKTKEFMEKSGSGTLPSLSLPPFLLTQKQAQKGKLLRSSLDLSGLISVVSAYGEEVAAKQGKVLTEAEKAALTQAFQIKGFSFYDLEDKGAVCLDLKDKSACVMASQKEVYEKVGALKQQIEAIRGSYGQDPNQILTRFNNLLQKGALNIQSVSGSTVALRGCTKVSYTVALENLTANEMTDFSRSIGFGGQSVPDETSEDPAVAQQKEQMKALLKQMIKELRQEVCLDNEHGAVLSYDFKMSIDMTPMIKGFAGLVPEEGQNKMPEEMAFTFKIRFAAIDFKPVATDFDFALPTGSQIWSIDDLLKMFPSSGLSGFGGTSTTSSGQDVGEINKEKTEESVNPELVFNGELYGYTYMSMGMEKKTYKLVGNEWVKVGTKDVEPKIVFNNELYGRGGGGAGSDPGTYKLVGNEWVKVGTKDVYPEIVFNNELYGSGGVHSSVERGTYKLVGSEWVKVGTKDVRPEIVFNNELYGHGELGSEGTYKLVGDEWVKVGTKYVIMGGMVFNNELYGYGGGVSDPVGTYKLVGDEWVKVGTKDVYPKIVFNNELYGNGVLGSELGTYKLVGNEWVRVVVGTKDVRPEIVFNNELYGVSLVSGSDGTYKLVGNEWVKVRILKTSGGEEGIIIGSDVEADRDDIKSTLQEIRDNLKSPSPSITPSSFQPGGRFPGNPSLPKAAT